VLSNFDPRENTTHRGNNRIVKNFGAVQKTVAWRMRIICHDGVGKNPNEIMKNCFLTYMYIGMKSDIVTHSAVALDVTQGSKLKALAGACKFSNCDAMAGHEPIPEFRPFIKNRMATYVGVFADD
jgi:hypothetical protein